LCQHRRRPPGRLGQLAQTIQRLERGPQLNCSAAGNADAFVTEGRIERRSEAIAFGMRVLAYDPYLALSRARALQVELVENLEGVYAAADFITVHMPMSDETRGMINAAAFAKMKKGVKVINCARGGIINEKDLYDAIKSGQVAGAALDVYEVEPPPKGFPLRELPEVIMTPHLGASTEEAQAQVAVEGVGLLVDFLTTGAIRHAAMGQRMEAGDGKVVPDRDGDQCQRQRHGQPL
jgi:D-3-phosphoglycerate dehydrogenase